MLLIGNGPVITREASQPYLPGGCVAIEDDAILEVGATAAVRSKYPRARFIDARGRLIMPGLINTHMHLYSTFARGMALKDAPPTTFVQILERLWWRLDKALTLDDVYYSALVPLTDCIKNGTTTIFDHHASPGAVRGSLFRIAEATRKAGVRTCLGYEVSDRDGAAVAGQGIDENREFLRHCRQHGDSLVKGMFGLHASFTLSEATLARCQEASADLDMGFHVHTAEGPDDLEHCRSTHGQRIVERFAKSGILGPKTIAAHCVHVDENEIELLKASGTSVVHNPESNMGNAVGCAPVLKMMHQGVRVGLGTDGYTSDMFESLKVANLIHKHESRNPSVGWAEAPSMLFEQNAAIAAAHFERPLGKLTPGAYADLIIVDYNPPTPLCPENIDSHILFGVTGRAVDTTVINGRVLMAERKLVHLDEVEITTKAREAATGVWRRL